jgi:tripartite-type tricarboxylate transporter receptor subunit TctC
MIARLLMLALVIATSGDALAQSAWPNRPIRFIVPFPAGSATDTIARLVAHPLGVRLGQQLIVDNRVGGSGSIGAVAVARALPDGYTLGLATTSTHAVSITLNPQLPYDPLKDFAAVSMLGSSPYVLVVYPGLPVKSVADLVGLAKAKPRTLNYASAGPASLAHLAGALFSELTGAELTHVPYRSSAQSALDLVEGRIQIQFGTLGPTLPHIRDGKLRPLGVTGAKRVSALPEVPTLAEGGIAGYEASLWMAIVMPAATPGAIVERLNRELAALLQSPELRAAFMAQGFEPESSTPAELRARIRRDVDKWRDVITKAGIRPE